MRHVLHRLFERYLTTDQHAFDASPRELWPSAPFEPTPQKGGGGGLAERTGGKRVHRELEPKH